MSQSQTSSSTAPSSAASAIAGGLTGRVRGIIGAMTVRKRLGLALVAVLLGMTVLQGPIAGLVDFVKASTGPTVSTQFVPGAASDVTQSVKPNAAQLKVLAAKAKAAKAAQAKALAAKAAGLEAAARAKAAQAKAAQSAAAKARAQANAAAKAAQK